MAHCKLTSKLSSRFFWLAECWIRRTSLAAECACAVSPHEFTAEWRGSSQSAPCPRVVPEGVSRFGSAARAGGAEGGSRQHPAACEVYSIRATSPGPRGASAAHMAPSK